jgi:Flp pilus assembly protein TadD
VLLLKEQADVDGARAAFQVAVDSGHPDAAPKAAVGLGLLLAKQGDVDGARAAYQLAVDSGHSDMAPMAMHRLRLLNASSAAWRRPGR